MSRNENEPMTEPPYLVAILIAARRTGDRLLERAAREALEQNGIKIRFLRTPAPDVEPTPCSR